jgi:hypothetical protein
LRLNSSEECLDECLFIVERSAVCIVTAPDTDPKKLNGAAARTAAAGCSNGQGGVRAGPDGTDPRAIADAGTHSREENNDVA